MLELEEKWTDFVASIRIQQTDIFLIDGLGYAANPLTINCLFFNVTI